MARCEDSKKNTNVQIKYELYQTHTREITFQEEWTVFLQKTEEGIMIQVFQIRRRNEKWAYSLYPDFRYQIFIHLSILLFSFTLFHIKKRRKKKKNI